MPALAGLALLADIVFWIGVLIFCLLCLQIAKALLGTAGGLVGWLPGVGGWAKHKIEDVAHKINSVMSEAMGFADQRVGAAIHDLARLTDWLGREIAAHANLLLLIAEALTGTLPASYILKEIERLTHLTGAAERAARGIGADVLPRIKTVERGIGADVLPRLRTLEKELDRTIEPEIAALRHRARELEDGALDTFKWIRTHPFSLATAAFVGAVAYALQRIGGTWIRCENWKRLGKHVCGLPLGLIEELLSAVIDVLLVADICAITKLMISAAESSVVQDALRGVVDGMDELLICQGVDRPPATDGYWTDLPPAQAFAALPA